MANFSRLHITSTLAILVLGLFLLSANAMADIVERSNPNNEYTASGTDVSTVQLAANAAEGDVIKVLNTESTATFSQTVKNTYTVRTFTIQSANENQQTINVSTGRCYDLNTASQTYNFTFENLFFQGNNTEIYSHGRFAILSSSDCTLNLTLNNVTFKQFKSKKNSDTALGLGGVIHIAGNTNILSLQGSSSDMIDNSSSRGGALSISATGLTSTVNNLTFKNNYATDDAGGAIYSNGPLSFTADNLTFEGNYTNNGVGGAINTSGKLTFNGGNLTFKNNSSKNTSTEYNGGAIYTTAEISITANSLTFENNSTSNGLGGAIYTSNNIAIDADTISFKDNIATKHSGGIYSGGAELSITGKNITFDGNKGNGNDGGAILSNKLTISGKAESSITTFKNNVAKNLGGAIRSTSATFKTGSFYFNSNSLTNRYTSGNHGGGAIDATSLSFTEANIVSFTKNTSKYNGGAINLLGSGAGSFDAKTITFTENTAGDFGGAIYSLSPLTIEASDSITFEKNSANNGQGGAI